MFESTDIRGQMAVQTATYFKFLSPTEVESGASVKGGFLSILFEQPRLLSVTFGATSGCRAVHLEGQKRQRTKLTE